MKDYTKKIITIPNLMSFFRLALIPFIMYAYISRENNILALVLIGISALSDILDGKIARRFNMVSDFGKFIDPVADKLTQIFLILALCFRIRIMIPIVVFLIIKEIYMLITGYLVIKATGRPDQAKWYGKACTVVLYASILLMILFPEMNRELSIAIVIVCAAFMLLSIVMYSILRFRVIKDFKIKGGEKKDEKEQLPS